MNHRIQLAGRGGYMQRREGGTCLVGDAGDEGLDVELCGAALLAGCIGTLEAASSLPQCSPLTQCGVLDVIKVVLQSFTCLQ